MALSLSSERLHTASTHNGVFGTFWSWVSARRAVARKRAELTALLSLEDARLKDMGVDRADVFDAIQRFEKGCGSNLDLVRARRASRALHNLNA